jgi:hypothetical protein
MTEPTSFAHWPEGCKRLQRSIEVIHIPTSPRRFFDPLRCSLSGFAGVCARVRACVRERAGVFPSARTRT